MRQINLDDHRWIKVCGRSGGFAFSYMDPAPMALEIIDEIMETYPERVPGLEFLLENAVEWDTKIEPMLDKSRMHRMIENGFSPQVAEQKCTKPGVVVYAYVSDNDAVQYKLMR